MNIDLNTQDIEYEFKKGSRINLNANKVYEELEKIRSNNEEGNLIAQAVVDYARNNPNSELHKGFEWDDTKAAEKYRLQQATQIIYNIRVVQKENIENPKIYNIEIIPYTHLDDSKGYQSTITILQDKDRYEQLKLQAYKDLIYWRNKYSSIVELEIIFRDIDNLNI